MPRPLHGVYPLTPDLWEWLTDEFYCGVDENVFAFWRDAIHLIRLVERVEAGKLHQYVAESAIREHNDESGCSLTYEEVKQRYCDEVPAWESCLEVFCDEPMEILFGPHSVFYEALQHANCDWAIVINHHNDWAVVIQSPHVQPRKLLSTETWEGSGLEAGEIPTFVLPAEIEATLR